MTKRVLVTGAGGPAVVAVFRSLLRRSDLTVFAADMDGWASGIYLVPPAQRRLVPPGRDDDFVPAIARMVAEDDLDLVISTVDVELIALAGRRDELAPAVLAAPSAEQYENLRAVVDAHCPVLDLFAAPVPTSSVLA